MNRFMRQTHPHWTGPVVAEVVRRNAARVVPLARRRWQTPVPPWRRRPSASPLPSGPRAFFDPGFHRARSTPMPPAWEDRNTTSDGSASVMKYSSSFSV